MRKPIRDALVITFDDGFLDNWIWAFPLLKKRGLKATIFVNPDFVDLKSKVRPNYDDYIDGWASLGDITRWGYLSWGEMKKMKSSGLIDIQSHTQSHTKYVVSDRLVGFHHPGADILYTAGNLFPKEKPYSLGEDHFDKLIPYGYPLFEERSAVIAKKVTVNPCFIEECIATLKTYDFKRYVFKEAMAIVRPLYDAFRSKDELIIGIETEEEYRLRVDVEIAGAKKAIEENLGDRVEFLCWPHGDNDEHVHMRALELGFLMTTQGKAPPLEGYAQTRIPERTGADVSTLTKKLWTSFKLKALAGQFPQRLMMEAYRKSH